MRNLMLCLAAGALLAAGTGAATAQQAVTINGVQASQVVIAPADSPLAQAIKDKLTSLYYGGKPGTTAYADAQKLYFFYGARHFEPIWLKAAVDGSATLSPTADKIIDVFKNAETEGFRPSDYLTPAIESPAGSDVASQATLETAFAMAAIHYAHDAYMGRIAPEAVSNAIDPETKELDVTGLLGQLLNTDSPEKVLAALDPQGREFGALKAALAKLDAGTAAPTPVVIPAGPLLRPGMQDPRVALLRQRLNVAAPETDADTYDDALVTAVEAFQTGAGTAADGIVGPGTLAALNRVSNSKITRDDIIANMERWRWLPSDLGPFYVMVNIPEFRVAVMQNDAPAFSTRVVVGKPDTPTPVFSNAIKYIVVNPYWNIPASIVAKEIKPHMLANPDYLARDNMQLVSGSHVIDPASIEWASVTQSNWRYTVRQLPGPDNALGQIKFLFPNDHDVYLHDTPSKPLFATAVRAYSHGCVRVQYPMDFANAVLQDEPGLTVDQLKAMFGPSERWVSLKNHVPVHIAYFTLRADADGTLKSFADIYGHNQRLIALLDGKALPATRSKTPIVSGV
ncbi:MAG TPA: L,D-transpeptidase family protein [Devosiaceae bacterium]|nr:L,D-transpeptidase family protein [Devosiaceae bacterium]